MADWLDILQNGTKPDDIVQAATLGQQQGISLRQQQADAAAKQADQARLSQYRSQVGDLLRGGDYTGASALAYAAGDDKAGTGLTALQKQHFDQGSAGTSAYANVVASVAALPYEQRAAAIKSAKPSLAAMGLNPAQIDSFDPTDNNIRALGHVGYTYGDQVKDGIAQQNADTGTTNAATAQYAEQNKRYTIDHDMYDAQGHLVARALDQTQVQPGATVYDGGTVSTSGGSNGAGYDTVVGNGRFGSPATPLSQMTIGDAINFGRTTLIPATRNNSQLGLAGTGMGSSAMGRYQITASTLARYAPAVLGPDWQSKPFDATAQEKVAEAIFNANKGNLASQWTSLTPATAAQAAKMPWSQARNLIASGESGGAKIVTQGGVAYTAPAKDDGSNDAPVDLTKRFAGPDLDQAAQVLKTTGKLPALGTGKDAALYKRAIMQRTAQLYPNDNLALNAANYHADAGSLNAQRKTQATIDFNDSTIEKNLGLMDRYYSNSAGHTSIPIWNQILQTGSSALGNGDTTAYKAAQSIVLNEVAKVMTSATGAGVLSDSARREAETYLYPGASPDQMRKGIAMLRGDIANRKSAISGSVTTIQNRMGARPQGASSNIPAGAAAMLRANPSLRAHFDQKYGAGASASVLGS